MLNVNSKSIRAIVTSILLVLPPIFLHASDISYSENDVKVAFLYRTLLYVKWDKIISDPAEPLVICTNTPPQLTDVMQSLEGRLVDARKIAVKQVTKFTLNNYCHIAYIHAPTLVSYKETLKVFENKQTLTVNDNANYVNKGEVLNFILNNKRISLEINLDIAAQKNIQFSAKLLRVAKILRNQNQ